MKAALVAFSLALNAALLVLLAVRPEIAPAPLRDFLRRTFTAAPAREARPPPATRRPPPRVKLWTRVYHEDPATFLARLRAAGFPATAIRGLVTAESNARYDARIRALENPDPDTPFWLMKPPAYSWGNEKFEAVNQLRRDRARATRELFADDFFASDDVTEEQRRQFGSLSSSKIDALQRIEDDYTEMNSAVRAASGGIMLPEDRRKLDLLSREKAADVAAALTSEELADYSLRSSPITRMLRTRWGEFDPSEAEFRVVFQAQKNLNERLGSNTFYTIEQRERDEAQAAYLWELSNAFGAARYSEFVWQTSAEYQQISRITERNNLPAGTPMQLFAIRDAIARESNRIFDERSVDVETKRAALKQLAQLGRVQISTLLGPTAGPSYLKVADRWLGYIENGAAVAFVKPDTVTVATEHGTHGYQGLPNLRRLPPPGR